MKTDLVNTINHPAEQLAWMIQNVKRDRPTPPGAASAAVRNPNGPKPKPLCMEAA